MGRFYDYIIVGSGASGAVMAHQLTQAGADVLMLEAGKHYDAASYSPNEMRANARLFWGGASDMNTDYSMLLLRGKTVGGGTVVNQCLLDRFDDVAFDDWRTDSDIGFFSKTAMQPYYATIENHLTLHTMQKSDWNRNAALYVEGVEKLGFEWSPLRRGQSNCGKGNDCLVCLGGCPRNSKQSMPVTFLARALNAGLELVSEFMVDEIIHGHDFVTVAGTQANSPGNSGQATRYYAKKCILAAGALGTTQLLLKSQLQQRLPALGQHFYCHPQFMNVGYYREPVDGHKGALQAVKSSDPRFRDWGFKLENIMAGPAAMAVFSPGIGEAHQQHMGRYRYMGCIEVAVRDQDPGTIRLDNSGRLVVQKTLSDGDRQRANRGIQLVKDIFYNTGAYETFSSPTQIGLHLMGGARMGVNEHTSVVNEHFKVHGMDNLYVIDSALFPNAPGINPSLTIMALALRAARQILAESGHSVAALDIEEAS